MLFSHGITSRNLYNFLSLILLQSEKMLNIMMQRRFHLTIRVAFRTNVLLAARDYLLSLYTCCFFSSSATLYILSFHFLVNA